MLPGVFRLEFSFHSRNTRVTVVEKKKTSRGSRSDKPHPCRHSSNPPCRLRARRPALSRPVTPRGAARWNNKNIITYRVISALAWQMVFERRTQTVLGPERGRDVGRRHVAVLRRQPDGVFRDSSDGRPVREHGPAAAATGSKPDARLRATRAHHAR